MVLIISPSSKLRIADRFFYGLLILQGTFFQIFNFFLNWLNRFPIFQFRQNSLKQVQIRSTWACFDHISLTIFFYGLLILQGKFGQNL